jgi:hypothetical protein
MKYSAFIVSFGLAIAIAPVTSAIAHPVIKLNQVQSIIKIQSSSCQEYRKCVSGVAGNQTVRLQRCGARPPSC